jgi:hypothetical protein
MAATQIQKLVGLRFAVVMLLVIIVIIWTIWWIIWLSSYVFVRSRHGAPLTNAVQGGADSTGGSGPQVGVVIDMDEAALDSSCPRIIYSEKARRSLKSGESDEESEDRKSCCSICLSDYKESEVVRVIPNCGHMFHTDCIDQWLRSHATCPICRISPQNLPTLLPQRTLNPTRSSISIPSVTQLASGHLPFSNMRF